MKYTVIYTLFGVIVATTLFAVVNLSIPDTDGNTKLLLIVFITSACVTCGFQIGRHRDIYK